MTTTGELISRSRLRSIPRHLRLSHEYAFFLHDENVRLLKEYEAARAHTVTIQFESKTEGATFKTLQGSGLDGLSLLKAMNRPELRRVVLNQITMAMASDFLHHVYEALRCLEKRKVIVALNLLRKPLLDNLTYLSWIVADEDGFYEAFMRGEVESLTGRKIGNRRSEMLAASLKAIELDDVVDAAALVEALFSAKNQYGLYRFFQHAVHLVTFERLELRTEPETFNLVFASPLDDGLYDLIYEILPVALLCSSNIVLELFDRISPMDSAAKLAFKARSKFGFYLAIEHVPGEQIVVKNLAEAVEGHVLCSRCEKPLVVTRHNCARMVLTDTFRCTHCRHNNPFPFSWTF